MTTLVGTGRLIRLILRRDRLRLPIWVVTLAGFPVFTASALLELYPTEAGRVELVATFSANPTFAAMLGPIYGPSIGALTAWRIGTIGALLVGLMAALTVIRHTRDEEEAGRRELLGATVTGRHAPLTAALMVVAGVAVTIGALAAAGLIALGLEAAGATAFGLGFASAALVFAAIAAAAAQLTQTGGSARGLAVGALGVAFTLRAAADAGDIEVLGWLSPVGWFTRLRPFAGERWWVLGLSLATSLAFGASGYWLSSHRDVGAGVFAPRAGAATAGSRLASPIALAWRLQRTALLGWSIGLVVVSAVYGSVANSVDDMINDSPQLAAIIEASGGIESITDTFFSFATGILALIVTAYSIRTALKLRVEEEGARAEVVLATATPRSHWMASHLVVACIGPVLMLMLVGAVMGTVYAAAIGDTNQIPRVFGIAMIQLPAVWVLTGATAALFGLWPRLTSVSWGLLVTVLVFGQLGQILRFPQWMLDLSPFTHVAAISIGDVDLVPVAVLVVIAFALLGSGFVGFARRDVAAS